MTRINSHGLREARGGRGSHNRIPLLLETEPPASTFLNRLEFLLSGKGTMPTVTLEAPLERDQSGAVEMDFGEVTLSTVRDSLSESK